MTKETEKLCLGVITGAHGIRGAVKVKSFTESPDALTAYGPLSDVTGKERFNLSVIGQAKGQLIVKIDEVKDRNKAEMLKGCELFIDRANLPEAADDEFYHADLVGLKALDEAGDLFGIVKAVFDFGAGDILELQRYDGKSVMMPFTSDVVPTIDLKAGHLVIVPPLEVSERDEHVDGDKETPDGGEF